MIKYRFIREHINKRRKYSRSIRDEEGHLLSNEKEIASRWTEYLEKLYKGSDLEQLEKERGDINAN